VLHVLTARYCVHIIALFLHLERPFFVMIHSSLLSVGHEHANLDALVSQLAGSNANDSAGNSSAGVASFLAFFVAATTEIVLFLVDHQRSTNDRMFANQGQQMIADINHPIFAVFGHRNVAKIAVMTDRISGAPMGDIEGIKMGARALAPIGQIAQSVNMKTVEACFEARDFSRQFGVATLGRLGERDDTIDAIIAT